MTATPITLEHTFVARGAAAGVLESRRTEVLVAGPAGTGKSRACLEKLHLLCKKYPNSRMLICRKTQASLASSALKTYREQVAEIDLTLGYVYFHGGGPQDPPQYRYVNPKTGEVESTITVVGIDKPSKIMSTEFDVIYVQEATELEVKDWEHLLTRLRNWNIPDYQQIIADCNPDAPTHWLKLRCDAGNTQLLRSVHEDNPTLFDEDGMVTEKGAAYIAKLDALTGVRYKRLRKGQWAAAEGAIYEEWDSTVHLIDPFDIPKDWPRYWSVDFGFTNPFVLQCWARDPDGRLYLYREIYKTKTLVEDHAETILNVVAPVVRDEDGNPVEDDNGKPVREWIEPKPQWVVCDHDAEGRETLRKHLRLPMRNAKKEVLDGIEAVQKRLRVQGDGKPRVFMLRHCVLKRDGLLEDSKKPTSTQDEVAGYVWDPSSKTDTEKEQPLKENDHGMDAWRYMVAQFDLRGGMGVKSL